VYRSYATLHFVFVVDGAESELGILDLIQVRSQTVLVVVRLFLCCLQVFVESLDRAFENVCELDLVFHFDEVTNNSNTFVTGYDKYLLGSPYPGRDHPRRIGLGDKC
jgi:AP-3 complex subunit sigma